MPLPMMTSKADAIGGHEEQRLTAVVQGNVVKIPNLPPALEGQGQDVFEKRRRQAQVQLSITWR